MHNPKSNHRIKTELEKFGDIRLPHWSSLSLWTLGVLLMLALTIRYLCPIFYNYFDEGENVAVKIGVENNFSESHFPALYVCVPTLFSLDSTPVTLTRLFIDQLRASNGSGSDCQLCRDLDEHSMNFWSATNLTTIEEDITRLVIDKLLSNLSNFHFNSNHHFSTQNTPMDYQLLIYEQILQFFKLLHIDDLTFYNKGRVANLKTWPDYALREERHWDFLIRSDRDLDDLFERVAEFVCFFYTLGPIGGRGIEYVRSEFESTPHKFRCVEYLKRTGNIVGSDIGDPEFCTPMPVYEFDNVQGFAPGSFAMESQLAYFDLRKAMHDGRAAFRRCIHTVTPVLRDSGPDLFPSLNCVNIGTNDEMHSLSIRYSLQATVNEKRKNIETSCYEEKSQPDCLARCKSEKILDECRCVPFSARSMITDRNSTYCDRLKYRECNASAFRRFNECHSECAYACQHDIFQWQVSESQSINQTKSVVEINPHIAPYLKFDVSNRDGIEDLIAQVGGIFNFYLGWSGLTLIFVLVYAWDCVRRRNTGDSTSASTALRMAMKWRLLTASESDHRSEMQSMRTRIDELEDELKQIKKWRMN